MIDSFVDTNVIKETKDLAARGRRSGAERNEATNQRSH